MRVGAIGVDDCLLVGRYRCKREAGSSPALNLWSEGWGATYSPKGSRVRHVEANVVSNANRMQQLGVVPHAYAAACLPCGVVLGVSRTTQARQSSGGLERRMALIADIGISNLPAYLTVTTTGQRRRNLHRSRSSVTVRCAFVCLRRSFALKVKCNCCNGHAVLMLHAFRRRSSSLVGCNLPGQVLLPCRSSPDQTDGRPAGRARQPARSKLRRQITCPGVHLSTRCAGQWPREIFISAVEGFPLFVSDRETHCTGTSCFVFLTLSDPIHI
ncbi:PlyM24 [Anopheles sinensis]|uniref:PlyM24 n=1 Tax=Anopheles sinensis TaxID=74873 RepID=A0A084W610_ANOSI|nr:PlyM24 [Anopheles sinensis]